MTFIISFLSILLRMLIRTIMVIDCRCLLPSFLSRSFLFDLNDNSFLPYLYKVPKSFHIVEPRSINLNPTPPVYTLIVLGGKKSLRSMIQVAKISREAGRGWCLNVSGHKVHHFAWPRCLNFVCLQNKKYALPETPCYLST